MKWSMTLTEDSAQFNLKAETPHEKELCKILSKLDQGFVRVHQGAAIAMNQAGYLRDWDRPDSVCAITISKPVPVTLARPEGLSQEA